MFPDLDQSRHSEEDLFSYADDSPDLLGDEGDELFGSMKVLNNSATPYSDATQVSTMNYFNPRINLGRGSDASNYHISMIVICTFSGLNKIPILEIISCVCNCVQILLRICQIRLEP